MGRDFEEAMVIDPKPRLAVGPRYGGRPSHWRLRRVQFENGLQPPHPTSRRLIGSRPPSPTARKARKAAALRLEQAAAREPDRRERDYHYAVTARDAATTLAKDQLDAPKLLLLAGPSDDRDDGDR